MGKRLLMSLSSLRTSLTWLVKPSTSEARTVWIIIMLDILLQDILISQNKQFARVCGMSLADNNDKSQQNLPLFLFKLIIIKLHTMTQPQQQPQQLQNLTLHQALQTHDLCFEEIFAIHDLHAQIKSNIKIFINYCKHNQSFTDKLISIGLKCPMHESSNENMKKITHIASDILTSDHQLIADLLIMGGKKQKMELSDNEDQISEQIESETTTFEAENAKQDRYKYLNKIFDYIMGQNIEQNCINYIVKCLQTLIRKKINQFYEYFHQYPEALARLTQLAHFPSVAQFISKLIADDDSQHLNSIAQQIRHKVIPFLLQKIHSEIHKEKTSEVLYAVEQILHSSRYGDPVERSELQELSDMIVSQNEIELLLKNLNEALNRSQSSNIFTVYNCIRLLNIILTRMNMDEQKDYAEQPQQFKPTLLYQVQKLFLSFANLVINLSKFEVFRDDISGLYKLTVIQYLETLLSMIKHSRFGLFYERINKEDRLQAIIVLIQRVASHQLKGIILQISSALAEKVIIEEERIASVHNEKEHKVSPQQLYKIIQNHKLHLETIIQKFILETTRQRNTNEGGIYIRKLLLILQNYFKNTEIHQHFESVYNIANIFPSFTNQNCRTYAQKTTILNHPEGLRAKFPSQFHFIKRTSIYLKDMIVDEFSQAESESLKNELIKQQILSMKQGKFKLQLTSKIEQMKSRVKNKAKGQNETQQDKMIIKEGLSDDKANNEQKKEHHAEKNTINNSGKPCLLFFVRHLSLY